MLLLSLSQKSSRTHTAKVMALMSSVGCSKKYAMCYKYITSKTGKRGKNVR